MFPEISARWSLLEPRFRYLSPGSEGEKCRPLDHMRQIPFIHSVQYVKSSHFYIYIYIYIYQSVPVTSSKWYVKVCHAGSYFTIAHVLFRNHEPRVENECSIQVILPNIQVLNCRGCYLYFISGDAFWATVQSPFLWHRLRRNWILISKDWKGIGGKLYTEIKLGTDSKRVKGHWH